MKRTGFIIAALAAAALAGTSAYADDLTFRTEEGTVVYSEEKGASVGISKEDLIRFGKEERNEDRAYEVDGKVKLDVGLEIGNADSGMTMNVKIDMDALYRKDASANEYVMLDMNASMFGQEMRQFQESYSFRDENGNPVSYGRETDDEGNVGAWREESPSNGGVVDDVLEGVVGEFELLDNMYTDEKGNGYYVLQATKTFGELVNMASEFSDDAEEVADAIEFDKPIEFTLMYRVDDCAFSRAYAEVDGLTGVIDGSAVGSEGPAKMTADGTITVTSDDSEKPVEIPEELLDESFADRTEAPIPASENGIAVTIEGTEFAIGSPARAFEESGWIVEKEYSGDETVEPDGLTYVKFAKDGMDLTAFVYNSGNETADALDCEVYEISFMKDYGDASNDVRILDGLVGIGMSEADLATALDSAGIDYVREDQGNYCYYEIATNGDVAGYEIGVNEDDGVWQIEARDESAWNN